MTACSEVVVADVGCDTVLHGIKFNFDSAKITAESSDLLDSLYRGLANEKTTKILILGHTSNEGPDSYNLELSQRRADSVVASLVKRGIQANKISGRGVGEQKPIADNKTDAGRSLNRRVEIACN